MTSAFHSIVYGPVKSRRLGQSLGINPVPTSREDCDPSCIYCQKGTPDTVPILSRSNQQPSAGVIVTSAARRIIELSKAGEKLESIVVSGNGDPTTHPNLLEVTENLRDLRNKWFPKAQLALLSESENLEADEVRRALRIYDRPILRFEWATAKAFTTATGRTAGEYKAIGEALENLDRLIIQASFGPANSAEADVKAWLKRVEELRPKEVQILPFADAASGKGGAKKSAKGKGLSVAKLEELANQLTEKTGIPATVYALETQPA